MRRPIEYTCRFCRTKRTFEWTLTDLAMLEIQFELWLANLCCQRCCDYYKARSKVTDRMSTLAHMLLTARQTSPKNLKDIEEAAKYKFKKLAEEFTALTTAFYLREDIDSADFAEAMFRKPQSLSTAIHVQVRTISTQMHELPPALPLPNLQPMLA